MAGTDNLGTIAPAKICHRVRMSESSHVDSLNRSIDAEMGRFMAWRLKFKRAIDTIDLSAVSPRWREHVRAYQHAWICAKQNNDADPRTTARNAVRHWLRSRPDQSSAFDTAS
jgi:hypothetical protein